MPTNRAVGYSQEAFINDALPVGTNEIGLFQRNRDALTAVSLLATAARTASGTGADVTDANLERASGLLLVLEVTAQSGTTPTLDVAVQAYLGLDNTLASIYTNLARFSQYGAATGIKALFVRRDLTFTTEVAPVNDPAVSTGLLVNNHDWLNILRVKWAIAGTTPSYTFNVQAYPIR